MSHTAVTFEDLLADFDASTAKWKKFFAVHPAAADVPTDIRGMSNIGELVWHIYAASLRHSQRLLGERVSDLEGTTPVKNLEGAWNLQSKASANLRVFLETVSESALGTVFHFQTLTGGETSATRRKLCLHIFIHAIRHWAQIGTIVRQNGHPPNLPQDILYSEVIQ
jgi:uncharacterized damage-inducible protein DinB